MEHETLDEDKLRLNAYIRRLERIERAAKEFIGGTLDNKAAFNKLRQAVEGASLLTDLMGKPASPYEDISLGILEQFGISTKGIKEFELIMSVHNQMPKIRVVRYIDADTVSEGQQIASIASNGFGLLEVEEEFVLDYDTEQAYVQHTSTDASVQKVKI